MNELTDEERAVAERYTKANEYVHALGYQNVANMTLERRIEMDVTYAKARAEQAAATIDYEAMIQRRARTDAPRPASAHNTTYLLS